MAVALNKVFKRKHMQYPTKIFTHASFSRKELVVIFSFCIILLIGIASKYAVDYHWNSSVIEVTQSRPTSIPHSFSGGLKEGGSPQQIRFQLNINKAAWYELDLLPKVGEVRAKAIVAYRKKYGAFQDINQLLNVKGINRSVVDKIKDYVFLGNRE